MLLNQHTSCLAEQSSIEQMSEPDLVDAAQHGDHAAFAQLIRSCERQVKSVLCRRISPEDVDDIWQAACLQAWQKIESFGGTSKFFSWMMTIALYEGTDMSRRKNRRERLVPSAKNSTNETERKLASNLEKLPDKNSVAPLDAVEKEDSVLEIRRAIVFLGDDYRDTISLLSEGRTYEEIAEQTSVPLNTVRSRVRRGRMELAEILAHQSHIIQPEFVQEFLKIP